VIFDGVDLVPLDRRRMRDLRGASLSMIFQEPMTALNPVIRVGDQIAEGLVHHLGQSRRRARTRAIELMRLVGIPDPAHRARAYPHQLSGGMRQRVMIAIALACEPRMLLCDEPTTALDVTIQAQILELLRELQARMGLGLLLITHDLGVVAEMGNRVAVMYAGRIVEHAPIRPLFAEPKHPYTRGLLASIPGAAPGTRLNAIPGTVPPLGQLPPGCSFITRCQNRFEPCPTAHPGDTAFVLADSASRTVKCYLHGTAAESAEVSR